MNRRRRALVAGSAAVVGVAMLAAPVAAAGYDSTTEALIRSLNRELLYIAVPITLLVEGILTYTVVRFRNNDDPKPTTENRRLEISWTVATAVILLFVGVAAFQVMANPAVTTSPRSAGDPPADALDVTVIGHQWFWEIRYPDSNVTLQSASTIYLPANRTIYFDVTSADVIHSMHVPGLALKQDAIPGEHHTIRTRITSTGEYQLYCAEFCGAGHSKMTAVIKVVPEDEYRQWVRKQKQKQ
ncbi:MAG: cytochrome c oxidase subunit II [Haloferacaceae archaeon]